jgi:hypothetical protein
VHSFPVRYRTSHFHFDVCSAPNDCKGCKDGKDCKDCKDGHLSALLARTADEASSLLARLPVSAPAVAVCGAGLDHSGPPILHWRCAGCPPPPRFSLAVDTRPPTADRRPSTVDGPVENQPLLDCACSQRRRGGFQGSSN